MFKSLFFYIILSLFIILNLECHGLTNSYQSIFDTLTPKSLVIDDLFNNNTYIYHLNSADSSNIVDKNRNSVVNSAMLSEQKYIKDRSITHKRFSETNFFKITDVPVALSLISVTSLPFKSRFQEIVVSNVPSFEESYDNYTQYLPAGVMLGLKALGVESRSGWFRMITADAFSTAANVILVNSTKKLFDMQRPDNSRSHNSYPSGHTATAFMTATMLHNEYGHISNWITIGSYSVATLTGLTRMFNDRHWISDVYLGAAIGVLATELGYYATDLIFKKRNLNNIKYKELKEFNNSDAPSFISIYTAICCRKNSTEHSLNNGGRFGLEGAWFMNSNIGFGGQATVFSAEFTDLERHLDMGTLLGGCYLSYPLTDRCRVGSKVLAGVSSYDEFSIAKNPCSVTTSTGLNIQYLMNNNLAFKLFIDHKCNWGLKSGMNPNEFDYGISIDLMLLRNIE